MDGGTGSLENICGENNLSFKKVCEESGKIARYTKGVTYSFEKKPNLFYRLYQRFFC